MRCKNCITGVKLKTDRPIGGNDESESVAVMIAEEKYPDIIFAKGSAGSLIDAGVMMDMTNLIVWNSRNTVL